MSFNVSISGRTIDKLPEGIAERHHPGLMALEADVLQLVEDLVAAIRAKGHEVTFGFFGSDYLEADMVAGTRKERDVIPVVVDEPPVPERGQDLVVPEAVTGVVPIRQSGQGPQPADPSAPVSEQDGTVTP